ncbi:Pyridoxine/pyridoxamine 5'-phosphate oxidase [Chlamydiales bacterium SCGC AB-751-O23]|jgi:pyridoxamine 5'-phosphate oxidase|nr:Pyridoxine/pyridoxamine 5'-phosphate oxidase [Chlamydiales bacterium SCGC AB-751-O23]
MLPTSSYTNPTLKQGDLLECPFEQLKQWQSAYPNERDANAAILATVSKDLQPSTRTVLIKDITKENGLLFFTNYQSNKAKDLEYNAKVSLTFYWRDTPRQCNLKGVARKVEAPISKAYFRQRPYESQLSSYTSFQSQPIDSRESLEKMLEKNHDKFSKEKQIPCPEFWGGYWIEPFSFEFWSGRQYRFHDRFLYEKKEKNWLISRIQP